MANNFEFFNDLLLMFKYNVYKDIPACALFKHAFCKHAFCRKYFLNKIIYKESVCFISLFSSVIIPQGYINA